MKRTEEKGSARGIDIGQSDRKKMLGWDGKKRDENAHKRQEKQDGGMGFRL